MAIQDAIFRRSELLLGDEAMKHIGPAVVRTITGPWCLVAIRGLLLHILCEVGQVHIALACQRVVHGEGGSEVVACLTHL